MFCGKQADEIQSLRLFEKSMQLRVFFLLESFQYTGRNTAKER